MLVRPLAHFFLTRDVDAKLCSPFKAVFLIRESGFVGLGRAMVEQRGLQLFHLATPFFHANLRCIVVVNSYTLFSLVGILVCSRCPTIYHGVIWQILYVEFGPTS